MAKKIDLKKSIRGLSFFTKTLMFFGGTRKTGDQFIFDRRGAIQITDKELTDRNGEITRIRGVKDIGVAKSYSPADSMVLSRPAASNFVEPSKAMESYHGWPYAAIKPIADEIAGIEWRFFKIGRGGKKEEIEKHDLIDFMESVNDFQTGPEFRHTLVAHLELTGNAFILFPGVKNAKSKPKSMYLLNPGSVKVKLDKTTYPYKVSGYEFTIDGKLFKYQPYEILQIKYPNPNNPYVGIGTVQAAAEWIDNDNNTTEFLRQFFKNGAQIGVTFETDMSSEDALHALRDSFNEQHSGIQNAYKAMFLPKGVKKPDTDVKFDDLGFDTLSDSNRDRILAAFRVPKTIIGAAEETTNRATAETADYVFARRTIKPKMILICSYLNEFLVPRFADDIFISFEDPVTEDKVATSALMKNATNGLPVISPNEAREQFLEMDPIDGGDNLLVPNNYTTADRAGEPIYMLTHSKEKVKHGKIGYVPARIGGNKTQFAKNLEIREGISTTITDRIVEIIAGDKSKKLKDLTDSEYDSVICKEKDERIAQYHGEIIKILQELNEKQKKEVLNHLPEAIKTVKALDVSKLFDMDKWINLTVSALKGVAVEIFGKEALRALQLIDQPGFDVVNTPEAQKALEHALELLGRSYNQTTIDMLEAKLTEGLAEGMGTQELGTLITDIYDWKNQAAAERVAITETRRIVSMSNTIAWKQSKVVKELRWITSGRDNVCEFCQQMDDTVISIDEKFLEHGEEFEGADGGTMTADYSAVGGPPLHPNCHCNVRPIVTTEIESSMEPPEIKGGDEEVIDAIIKDLETSHD